MIDAVISLENVSFRYQEESDTYQLKDVTFHVKHGEWVSIVGHNGSGKSTTVRLIDGLLVPESGQVCIDGQVLTSDNVWEIRRKIGMVFQNPDNQFVGATVEDDVAFGLENQGVPREEMTYRVDQALDLVGMTAFKEREPSRLSGGQKQRVAIAGIIAMAPSILILDEATSMLDPHARLEIIETIQNIRQERPLTVISITHDLDEVALSDRVLVMKEGQLVFDLTPNELFLQSELLSDLGLDQPFTSKLQALLEQKTDWQVKTYLTEKELGDSLWELFSNK